MSESSSNSASGGIGFCGVLTIVFIVLKLVGVIKWSWVWVLSPLWIPFVAVVAVAGLIVLPIMAVLKMRERRLRGW